MLARSGPTNSRGSFDDESHLIFGELVGGEAEMQPRHQKLVLILACVVSVLVANGAYGQVAQSSATTIGAQEPSAAETALDLARPARRLIQQGLRVDGFDPGTPDGLFGPRTRAAIRDWQSSRGGLATGYLTGAETEILREAGTSGTATSESEKTVALPPDAARATGAAEQAAVAPVLSVPASRAGNFDTSCGCNRGTGARTRALRRMEHGGVLRVSDGRRRVRVPCRGGRTRGPRWRRPDAAVVGGPHQRQPGGHQDPVGGRGLSGCAG